MKIVIDRGAQGNRGGIKINRAPDFSQMSGDAEKFKDDRTTSILCKKKYWVNPTSRHRERALGSLRVAIFIDFH